jgi:hypothetical protein
MAKGFTLYMVKAVMNGRTDEVIELARTNLWRWSDPYPDFGPTAHALMLTIERSISSFAPPHRNSA